MYCTRIFMSFLVEKLIGKSYLNIQSWHIELSPFSTCTFVKGISHPFVAFSFAIRFLNLTI